MAKAKHRCGSTATRTGRPCQIPTAGGMCARHLKDPPGPGGRPSIWSPELQESIVDMIAKGAPLIRAAEAHGSCASTMRQWRERAEEGEEPYRGFMAAVTRARGQAVGNLAVNVFKWIEDAKDIDRAMEVLARRDHKHWGTGRFKDDPKAGKAGDGTIAMTPEQFYQALQAAAATMPADERKDVNNDQ